MRAAIHRIAHELVGAIGAAPLDIPEDAAVARLLCIVHGGLGDRLMTLPALRLLRKRHPNARMCVAWCGESLRAIDAEFDETLRIRPNALIEQWRLMRRGWDCLFVNSIGARSISTELTAATSVIPLRIGPRWPFQKRSAYNRPYDIDNTIHVTAANCVAAGGGGGLEPQAYHVSFPQCAAASPAADRPFVLHTGGRVAYPGYERNRWPPRRFAELAKRIVSDGMGEVVAILGPDDAGCGEQELRAAGARIARLKSLGDLFSTVASARLLIGND